jgi:uncharacterized Fe-S cluster protein YjdI
LDKKNLTKKYTNGEITVIWKNALCIHSRICFTELIEVFNPRVRPWINMQGASTKRIIEQVERCPSKALTWEYNNLNNMNTKNEISKNEKSDIDIINNGPIKVNNNVVINDAKKGAKPYEAPVFLCRCGGSHTKPFCDGSHRNNGFND